MELLSTCRSSFHGGSSHPRLHSHEEAPILTPEVLRQLPFVVVRLQDVVPHLEAMEDQTAAISTHTDHDLFQDRDHPDHIEVVLDHTPPGQDRHREEREAADATVPDEMAQGEGAPAIVVTAVMMITVGAGVVKWEEGDGGKGMTT